MELNEAVKRILGQHGALICAIALLPVLAVIALHQGDTPAYTAKTRMVLDTPDPQSSTESVAIADTGKAIATSPAEVQAALAQARVRDRDAATIARERVGVRALGTSGVLELSVTDSDPGTAAALANALAARVIATRVRLSSGELQQRLTELDKSIDQDTKQISRLDGQADDLLVQATAAGAASNGDRLRVQREAALRQRDVITQRRTARESERANLLASLTARPDASIISPATRPLDANPSGTVPDVVLAGLLGLILGVGMAALLETLRPTLVGGDAVAAELDAPLLAHVGDPATGLAEAPRAQLANRLRMSAEAAHVRSVTLLAARQGRDFRALARLINDALTAPVQTAAPASGPQWARGPVMAPPPTPSAALPVFAFGVDVDSAHNSGTTGLVVVVPATVKKDELADARHLLRVSPAPLLGVVTYDAARPSRIPLRRALASAA